MFEIWLSRPIVSFEDSKFNSRIPKQMCSINPVIKLKIYIGNIK